MQQEEGQESPESEYNEESSNEGEEEAPLPRIGTEHDQQLSPKQNIQFKDHAQSQLQHQQQPMFHPHREYLQQVYDQFRNMPLSIIITILQDQNQYYPFLSPFLRHAPLYFPQADLIQMINQNLQNNQFNNSNRPPRQTQLTSNTHRQYYKLRTTPLPQITFKPDKDPHLKISSLRQWEQQSEQVFYVTKYGMVGTHKNTDTNDIMIGRQQLSQQNDISIHPNDIVLPEGDRAISRLHCKIITKYGFEADRTAQQQDFKTFLKTIGTRFPINIRKIIHHFMRKPPTFYMQDLGSVQGTYLKLPNLTEQVIEVGNSYSIGADTIFTIQELRVNLHQYETVITQIQIISYKTLEFNQYIEYEKQHNVEIKGQFGRAACGMILKHPYLKILFPNHPHQQSHEYLFLGQMKSCGNSAVIRTMMSQQLTILYLVVSVGFGTVLFVINGQSAMGMLVESLPMELGYRLVVKNVQLCNRNGCEVKISESVLKIEMLNFDKSGRKQISDQEKFENSRWLFDLLI